MNPITRFKLSSVLTAYDRRQSTKRSYNPYALAHYFGALQRADVAMQAGEPMRTALCANFCGRLLDVLLRVVSEPKSTDAEQRQIIY